MMNERKSLKIIIEGKELKQKRASERYREALLWINKVDSGALKNWGALIPRGSQEPYITKAPPKMASEKRNRYVYLEPSTGYTSSSITNTEKARRINHIRSIMSSLTAGRIRAWIGGIPRMKACTPFGSQLSFEPGDLTITLDKETGKLTSQATLSSSYEILPMWLIIAAQQCQKAEKESREILASKGTTPDEVFQLLMNEMIPAILAIVACGIAMDALQEQLEQYGGVPEETKRAWGKNKTSRTKRLVETIKHTFQIPQTEIEEYRTQIDVIMKWRGRAVHPPSNPEHMRTRPDIEGNLDWNFCAYRYENSIQCFENAMGIVWQLSREKSKTEKAEQMMKRTIEMLVNSNVLPESFRSVE